MIILRNSPRYGDLQIEFFDTLPTWKPDMTDFLSGFSSIRSLYTGLVINNTIYPEKINILNKNNKKYVKINYYESE